MPSAFSAAIAALIGPTRSEPGLKMIDAALRLSPDIHGGHFLRGRILMQLGRREEARVEFAAAQKRMQGKLDKEREGQDEDRPESA